MDANGIYDIQESVTNFIYDHVDWCKNEQQADEFEKALVTRGVKFTKEVDHTYGFQATFHFRSFKLSRPRKRSVVLDG